MDKREALGFQMGAQMGFLFFGRTIAFAVTFAIPLVLARVFAQEEFGLYKQLFLIHATLTSILTFGFSSSLFYFVPRESDQQHRYVSQTLLALFVLALAGAGVLIAFKSQVARALNNPELEPYIPYLAAFAVLSLLTSFLESLMIILKQAKLAALTSLGSEVLKGGLMIGAAVLTRSMLILVLAALVWAGCRFIALLAYLRKMGMPLWASPEWNRLGGQVRYAFPFGLAVILGTLSSNLHQYVVSYLYTPALFAIYSVGLLQIPLVSIAFESVSDVTLVRLTELRHKGMLEEAARLLGESVTKLCLFLLPLYAWLLVSARDLIVVLFTGQYEASVEIFRIFLAMIPLTAINMSYVPRAFAETGFIFRVNIVFLAMSALLLLAFTLPLGLSGAALAAVLATAIEKTLVMRKVATLLAIPLGRLLPWRRLSLIAAASAIAGYAAWEVHAGRAFGGGTRVCLSSVLFAFCYGMLAWTVGLIAPDEKRRVMEMVGCGPRRLLPDRASNEPATVWTEK